MEKQEIIALITELTNQGLSLSSIQDELKKRDVKMTFMELRLLASEIESGVWKAQEKVDAPAEKADDKNDAPSTENEKPKTPAGELVRGKTTVSVSPIQRPGFAASGSVTFSSGSSADWYLDQNGRLGLDNLKGDKPDEQDVKEFQVELQKAFGA